MKYLPLLLLCSLPAFAETTTNGQNQSSTDVSSITNTAVYPSTIAASVGDILPSMGTVSRNSATCADNQFIVSTMYTDSSLTGVSSLRAGTRGNAIMATLVMPWGDDGTCKARQKAISRDAALISSHNNAAITHDFCWKASDDLVARGKYADDDYFEEYDDMRKCRKVFVMSGVANKIQAVADEIQ